MLPPQWLSGELRLTIATVSWSQMTATLRITLLQVTWLFFFFFMLDFVYSSCSENALSLDALVLCLMIMMMMILERNGDGSHF